MERGILVHTDHSFKGPTYDNMKNCMSKLLNKIDYNNERNKCHCFVSYRFNGETVFSSHT